jgi:glucose/arabinose dehydrogenase
VEDGVVRRQPYLDIASQVATSPRGAPASEQGLLSLAFAPDYASAGRLAVAFTAKDGAVTVTEYVGRHGRADPGSARTLLRVPKREPEHNGGQLHYGPDGLLYVGTGDDDSSPSAAQEPGRLLGRILRLDGGWETVAYGLRNPWRWSFDRATGDIWIGDVGENDWEEVDRLVAGAGLANLGWDAYEGFAEYEGTDDHSPDGDGELVPPIAVYDHAAGCSVTGGYVYRGKAIPPLTGRYIYGDYCTGQVWSLDPADPARVRLELELGTTLVSFGEDPGGELYLVSRTGRVFLLAT